MTDTFAENAKDALDIRLDEKGGFDELVAKDARYVHVEVLDRTAVYIGVQTADGRVAKLTVCANRLSYYYEVSGKQIAENANCSGWLPIESAPRDGTTILGAFFNVPWPESHREGDVVKCWYQEEFGAFISSCREMQMHNGYAFGDGSTRQLHSPVVEDITHWMPLPPPPENV